MLTSCSSPHSSFRARCSARGFSLVELLISAAIITIISALIIVRFTTFDSSVLLKSLAYDVAASIRNAQSYSVSVLRDSSASSFRSAYGMDFRSVSPKTYTFFSYKNLSAVPQYGDGNSSDVSIFSIGKTMQIKDLCVNDTTCGLSQLDISFKRPEFRAYFYAKDTSNTIYTNANSATIKLYSSADTSPTPAVWDVTVSLLGQITVKKE